MESSRRLFTIPKNAGRLRGLELFLLKRLSLLYDLLGQLDIEGVEEAYIDKDFPKNGLWATIAERLSKAALHVSLSSEENRVR